MAGAAARGPRPWPTKAGAVSDGAVSAEREARALDAEIREVEELRILEVDPDGWHHAGDRAGPSLEEYIAAVEKELGRC